MSDSPISDELRDLIQASCSECLTDAQARRLEALLLDHPERQIFYIQMCRLHAEVRALIRTQRTTQHVLDRREGRDSPSRPTAAPPSSWRRGVVWLSQPVRFGLFVATVSVISLTLTFAQIRIFPANGPAAAAGTPGRVATVAKTRDCQWGHGAPLRTGAGLTQGQVLRLQSGTAELKFSAGAQVVLIGPTVFQLESTSSGRLTAGKLQGRIPPRAVGFTVRTPSAEVIDLGTEFGVEVLDDGAAEVHVFQGKVRVAFVGAASAEPLSLSAGHAVYAADSAGSFRQIALDRERFDSDAADHDGTPSMVKAFDPSQLLQPTKAQTSAVSNTKDESPSLRELQITEGLLVWLDGHDVDGDGDAENNRTANSPLPAWINKAAHFRDVAELPSNAVQLQPQMQPLQLGKGRHPAGVRFVGQPRRGQSLVMEWRRPTPPPYTIFLVGQVIGNSPTNATDYWFDGERDKSRVAFGVNPSGYSHDELFAHCGAKAMLTQTWTAPQWQAVRLYSLLCQTDAAELWIDGARKVQEAVETGPIAAMQLGARFTNNHFLNGAIGDLLIYDRALLDSERRAVEDYLSAQWSLPLEREP